MKKIKLMAKASSGLSTTSGKMQAKAIEKLKRKIKKKGNNLVLILTTHAGSYGISDGTRASITEVAYS